MSEWKPIKTAPSGKYVLVGAVGSGHPVVMAYKDHRVGWLHTGARWTHWMPVPELPDDIANKGPKKRARAPT